LSVFDQLLTIVGEQPLSRSLLVALRIAPSIADEELTSWIKLELMGYLADNPEMKEDTIVPEYRAVPGLWYDDYDLVLALDDPDLAFINEFRLRHGVAELEGIAVGTKILVARPAEFSEIIRKNLNVVVSVFKFRPSMVPPIVKTKNWSC
jgi:hypothetical protein